ncbi:MAG: hypothetical protein A3G93_01030 [Nitrospinae bacterium RIFCSPLOWO2_12_FULL_45_22]|nr:MAG: hypothetical protein A3G93_01030 [Nitrospinae bacterium RIFCSPLOWO2_12_FULL_45_22]
MCSQSCSRAGEVQARIFSSLACLDIGSRHPAGAPANAYPCRDGYVVLAASLERHWAKPCQFMGREELIDDLRTKTVALRVKNVAFVDEAVGEWARDKTVDMEPCFGYSKENIKELLQEGVI